MFNSKLLKIARQRRRLSAKLLAERTGLTAVTITRLETGKTFPEPETIKLISRELGFPESFFYGHDIDELPVEAASFRSLTSMKSSERDAVLAAGSIAYMLADWVDSQFKLPENKLIDLSQEPNPETAAITLRQVWGLGEQPISNMIKLVESKGIRVFSLTENTRNVDAFSCWRGDTPFIFLNTFKSPEHSRFDAAHELAHLVLHKHGGPGGKHQREIEADANAFASAFLMPAADIRSILPVVPSFNTLITIKRRWGVSLAALTYRLYKLNILSEARYRNLYIQISKLGYRLQEPNSIDRERSIVWDTIFTNLWSSKISRNQIAHQLNIPFDELENLVFTFTNAQRTNSTVDTSQPPKLTVIKNNTD